MPKENKNQHIIDYLDNYFNMDSPPYYAVLLSGEWGCGKTWLIRNIIESYNKDKGSPKTWLIRKIIENYNKDKGSSKKNEHIIYISLFGMKDITEINLAIFQQISPVFSAANNYAGMIGAIAGSVSMHGASINLDGKNAEGLAQKAINKLVKSSSKKIIVFDDLERSTIDKKEMFGYINRFVEQEGRKIVILANDEELFKNSNKKIDNNDISDLRYKEKIIGATLRVESCFQDAFQEFIKLITNKETKKILQEYKKTITYVHSKVGRNNLRSLRQAIILFPDFINKFPKGMIDLLKKNNTQRPWHGEKTDSSTLDHIVQVYFYLSLEEKNGLLNKDNWGPSAEIFCSHSMGILAWTDNPPDDTDTSSAEDADTSSAEDMGKQNILSDGILGEFWYPMVIESKVEVDGISILSHLDTINQEMDRISRQNISIVWDMLKNSINMDKLKFKQSYGNLLDEINGKKLYNFGELLHAAGILMHYHEKKAIPLQKKDIYDLIYKNINDYIVKEHFEPISVFDALGGVWGGYSIWAYNTLKEEGIVKLCMDGQDKRRELEIKKDFINLIKKLKTDKGDIEELSNGILHLNKSGKFSNHPVFSYIDKDDRASFFDSVNSFNHIEVSYFLYNLMDRYNLKVGNAGIEEHLIIERDFLEDLTKYYQDKIDNEPRLYNPAVDKYEHFIKDLQLIMEEFKKVNIKDPEQEGAVK